MNKKKNDLCILNLIDMFVILYSTMYRGTFIIDKRYQICIPINTCILYIIEVFFSFLKQNFCLHFRVGNHFI